MPAPAFLAPVIAVGQAIGQTTLAVGRQAVAAAGTVAGRVGQGAARTAQTAGEAAAKAPGTVPAPAPAAAAPVTPAAPGGVRPSGTAPNTAPLQDFFRGSDRYTVVPGRDGAPAHRAEDLIAGASHDGIAPEHGDHVQFLARDGGALHGLADRYGLNAKGRAGLEEEADPHAAQMAEAEAMRQAAMALQDQTVGAEAETEAEPEEDAQPDGPRAGEEPQKPQGGGISALAGLGVAGMGLMSGPIGWAVIAGVGVTMGGRAVERGFSRLSANDRKAPGDASGTAELSFPLPHKQAKPSHAGAGAPRADYGVQRKQSLGPMPG